MFKSIEYKLFIYLGLLIVSVAAATYCILQKEYVYGPLCVLIAVYSINRLYKHYKKFNQNILFLLNALDNGDYSFNFSETKISKREQELNQMMNRIKEILSRARKEVIENEKFLSLIVESVSTGIIILDEYNNVLITNRATNEMLGLPVFTHLNQLKVIDDSYPAIFANLETKDNKYLKIANEREETQVSMRLSKITLKRGAMKIITLNSIGNELEAKEMESWVRLIRVMTHEIMNSIAPITSLTDTLLFSYKMYKDNQSDDNLRKNTVEALETIGSTAKGLMVFVDSYRRFTGVPKPQLAEFDLIPLVEKVVSLESAMIQEKGISLELLCITPSLIVYADESQITQVLVNLVKNAVEALDSDKRSIKIKISHTDNKTSIDICNNGEPIPQEVIPNIFIPFFTTKNTGTGIGLSISRYIMRLHGGNLKHHAKDGWTIFSMTF